MNKSEERKRMDEAAKEVVQVILRNSPNCGWVDSGGSSYSRIDGMLYKGAFSERELCALVEIKCRNISAFELFSKYDCELMVDESKIDALKLVSSMLCAPAYLVVYLLKSGAVLQLPITNSKGQLTCKMRSECVSAPSTMGGSVVEKKVAKIKIDGSTILSTEEKKS